MIRGEWSAAEAPRSALKALACAHNNGRAGKRFVE
jgi:hypothetical protein